MFNLTRKFERLLEFRINTVALARCRSEARASSRFKGFISPRDKPLKRFGPYLAVPRRAEPPVLMRCAKRFELFKLRLPRSLLARIFASGMLLLSVGTLTAAVRY